MIVVADSGPLHYLIAIDHIDILPSLFNRVLIPEAVRAELTHSHTPTLVRSWMANPPEWLEMNDSNYSLPPETADLDDGERQAISLALQVGAEYILMDDDQGRRAAIHLHRMVIGTVGILERAAAHGLLDFKLAFAKLSATNFRMSPGFRRAILERIKEQ